MNTKRKTYYKPIIVIGIAILILIYFGYRNHLMIEKINTEYKKKYDKITD